MGEMIRILEDARMAKAFTSPTRRAIIKELALRPMSISRLARTLDISPPAVLYHIRIMERAGLIKLARTEVVRNNFEEKFYALTSPAFMIMGENKRGGPVPLKEKSEGITYIARVEGVDEYLSGFDLRVREGHGEDLEKVIAGIMRLIAQQALELGKDAFAQLDLDLSKSNLDKIGVLSATLAPIAVSRMLDVPEAIELLHSLKDMVESGRRDLHTPAY